MSQLLLKNAFVHELDIARHDVNTTDQSRTFAARRQEPQQMATHYRNIKISKVKVQGQTVQQRKKLLLKYICLRPRIATMVFLSQAEKLEF